MPNEIPQFFQCDCCHNLLGGEQLSKRVLFMSQGALTWINTLVTSYIIYQNFDNICCSKRDYYIVHYKHFTSIQCIKSKWTSKNEGLQLSPHWATGLRTLRGFQVPQKAMVSVIFYDPTVLHHWKKVVTIIQLF